MWCGSSDHSVVTCPRRQKAIDKGVARSLALPSLSLPLAYVMSKKKDTVSSMIVTSTLFLKSKPIFVLCFIWVLPIHLYPLDYIVIELGKR